MIIREWQKRIVDKVRRGERPILNPPPTHKVKAVEVAWRPDTQVPTETTRERFLRERRHRRRAANRTRNAVAKQSRKVNR